MARQSELREYAQCRRKWWWQYVEGYSPVRSGPDGSGRGLGTITHVGLAAYYNDEDWRKAILAAVPEGEEYEWEEAVQFAMILVEGYVDWAEQTGVDASFKVLGVEFPFTIPKMDVTGTMDLVGYDELHQGVIVLDHKTVTAMSQRPPQTDFQLLTYALGYWRTTGIRPVGVGHNLLKKVKRTGRAAPPFFDRHINHVNEDQLLKHERHLHVMASEAENRKKMLNSVEHPMLFPNPNRDCSWRCDFVAVCSMVDEGADYASVLESAYEIRGAATTEREEPHE